MNSGNRLKLVNFQKFYDWIRSFIQIKGLRMAYTLYGTEIIYEVLDDEVIIANLDSGVYYSIRGSGVAIWQLLIGGHSLSSIQSLFTKRYGSVPSFSSFVERLLEENLLTAKEDSLPVPPSFSWPADFSPPILERYDEMKNLLMLDPIHEVDEQGWPRGK